MFTAVESNHCSEFRGTGSKPTYGISLLGFLKSQDRGSQKRIVDVLLESGLQPRQHPLVNKAT